ncbi:MAG: hypothetical protein A2275_15360 [Bacteroidetes bacterium RIFOXYA12_FULL_35_11]|nr:MAG: hypothetical protein A2X01_14140 [Bacteroidetes bacterium GWF2_35_48]OFY73325.1 MAG: hypothetical protein A2275_15360 [Bacteroidetes bacterium RIFOXYA12_FULL_35_11]OFY93428.1 MAG: hypothetical protein A2309_10070 [Bacteroidetes bacterium RIFOXYB2_FULL_35_7]OFZ02271.1 MAG: hypothetical protein A2491_12570 [Bacteroidetes bacterium RIFOXYC12_FULL_35_7]HBX52276.1 hypothetical protein [Bacteroidales bacterium]
MKMNYLFLFIIFPLVNFAQQKIIKTEFPVPSGYNRIEYDKETYAAFVQSMPLKKDKTIKAASGKNISNSLYKIWGVVDFPLLFKSDIEQCADYSMRIWAEYHKQNDKLNELYLFDYSGNRVYFKKQKKDYKGFLQHAFAYSNSSSMKRGCKTVSEKELQPGDMFVQNETGGIGHVSVIVDICKNTKGDKLYLVGYSFMPAQEFHIEKAQSGYGIDGWFTLDGYNKYLDENLNFGKAIYKRFIP